MGFSKAFDAILLHSGKRQLS